MLSKSGRILLKSSSKTFHGRVITSTYPYSTSGPDFKCSFAKDVTEKDVPNTKLHKLTFTEEEYQNAKPFKDIPGPSGFKLLTNMVLPFGRYFGKDMVELFRELQKEYGNFVRFPSLLGKSPMYFIFDCNDSEVVFRNEGPTPFRRNLEIFTVFRNKERPDLFGEMAGLIQE